MSYLVMECHPGYAVLLDEEGRFLKAANFRYEVGQTVYDPVLMEEAPEKQRHVVRWISSGIAAIAACILLFFGFSYYQNYIQSYSSIYLTINPEVQMDLNRQGTVVALNGTNEDGKTLLEGYDGKGKDKVTVAGELIDRAIEMGFLSEGGRVSFSIDSPDDALFQEYGMELRTSVTEHLDGRITITIEIVNYKNGQREESTESSPSPSASSSRPAPSQPAPASPSTSRPSQTGASGSSDYDDTDYGPNNNGATGYTPPAVSTPASADTNYGSGGDYTNGDTDYGPGNDSGGDNDDDGGDSGYDDDTGGDDGDDTGGDDGDDTGGDIDDDSDDDGDDDGDDEDDR